MRVPWRTTPATAPSTPTLSPFAVAMICAMGVGCVMFDQTSLVVAAPTIADEFGAGIGGLQWLTALFPLVAASTMPVSGMLGQRLGARTTVQLGLAILVLGGILAATAGSLAFLLCTRIVQGIGAALILPNAATLVGFNVPDPSTRARAIGHWMTAGSTALLLGPLLSGLLAQHLGWRFTFLVTIPIAVVTIVALSRLRNTPRQESGRLDVLGLVTACATLAVLAWALIGTGRQGMEWTTVTAGYLAAAVLAGAFVLVERRATNPVLDLNVFTDRSVRLILVACLAYNAAINGTAILISVYFQDERGFSASAVGVMILIANLGMPVAGILISLLRNRLDNLQLLVIGLVALAFAYLALGAGSALHPAILALPLAAIGLGAGVLYFVDTNTILDKVTGPDAASAMAALALMRQIGSVLGIAAMASIGQLAASTTAFDSGEPAAFLVSGIALGVIGAFAAVRLRRR